MTSTPSLLPTFGTPDSFNVVGFIIDLEEGNLSCDEAIEGFQKIIDSGLVWQLQGSYGRAAQQLIEQGLCTPPDLGK